MSFLQLVLVVLCATIALAAIMAAAWRFQQAYDRTGWIDVTWTLGTGGVGLLAALAPLGHLAWPGWRQVAVGILVAAWSLRLGLHIAARSRLTGDDPRYRQLIAQWGVDAKWGMFGFLQSQAAVGVILVAAVALAAHNPDPNLRIQDLIGRRHLGRSHFGRSNCGPAAAAVQVQSCESRDRVRRRPVAMVAAPQLFLRVAGLGRLPGGRH